MGIGVLLMTHPGIGSSILHSAARIYGEIPLALRCLEVPVDVNVETIKQRAEEAVRQLDEEGLGVLILTDVFGATPDNIARNLLTESATNVLAGLSLPMLLRVFNYPLDNLSQLCAKAVEGGARGVYKCVEKAQ